MGLFPKKASTKEADTQEPLVAIDIGSYRIRLIAGMVSDTGEVDVVYYDERPSQGMFNGSVSDLHALSGVLSDLVQSYESATSNHFKRCMVSIAGKHIESRNEKGEATVPSHTITENDRKNALQHARSIKIADHTHLIHVIPQAYMTDVMRDSYGSDYSHDYITNPLGMSAMRLSVGVHLIACDEDQDSNLRAAVEQLSADATVEHVIFTGIASADAVLTQAEKEIGVCLVDLGEGTVNVAVYNDGKLILTFGLSLGGSAITKDIATRFGIPLHIADVVKCRVGTAHYVPQENDHPMVSITTEEEEQLCFMCSDLSGVIIYKLTDIFAMVCNRIDNFARTIKEPIALGAGFVLTGGVANTDELDYFVKKRVKFKEVSSLSNKVRIGVPRGVKGNYEILNSPESATAVGLLRLGHNILQEENHEQLKAAERKRQNGVIAKTWRTIKDWLSQEL